MFKLEAFFHPQKKYVDQPFLGFLNSVYLKDIHTKLIPTKNLNLRFVYSHFFVTPSACAVSLPLLSNGLPSLVAAPPQMVEAGLQSYGQPLFE